MRGTFKNGPKDVYLEPIAKCQHMAQIPYIFNQLVSFVPKDLFDRLVLKYKANHYVKNYTCWNHLLVMMWAQLTGRRSLRDIESSLRAHSDKTYRMGTGRCISRNNIANANARRDVAVYRELALAMMRRTAYLGEKDEVLSSIRRFFNLNGFFAVDSSSVSLELSRHQWSEPQQGVGGIKMHTLYDLLRCVPRMCLITGHEERDQTFMEDYPFESGCFYMFDKMYFKTRGMERVRLCGAYFVIRIKSNAVYDVLASMPVDGLHILADRRIRFTSQWASRGYPENLRLISFYSTEKNAVINFVTNNFDVDAATIVLLYKYRWQIELFFRWIKQHLRVTSFYGTSANAVMIQIYIAYITFCTLAIAADNCGFKGSLYDFSNIVSVSLTEKIMLTDLVRRYHNHSSGSTEINQPTLFDFDILL